MAEAAGLSLAAAIALADAATAAANVCGAGCSVAVTDAGGALRAFARSDDAFAFGADVAIAKARTAATSGMATHIWNSLVDDPQIAPLAGFAGLCAVGGGYPIRRDGRVIGAIGVSGGPVAQDRAIAEAALAASGFAAI